MLELIIFFIASLEFREERHVYMYIQYNNMTSNTPLDSDPDQDGMMDLV